MATDAEVQAARDEVAELRAAVENKTNQMRVDALSVENDRTLKALQDEKAGLQRELNILTEADKAADAFSAPDLIDPNEPIVPTGEVDPAAPPPVAEPVVKESDTVEVPVDQWAQTAAPADQHNGQ